MNALEEEIIAKFRQLDGEARQRVLVSLEQEADVSAKSLSEALRDATIFREKLREKYGAGHFFGAQDMLDELREEASWPRW